MAEKEIKKNEGTWRRDQKRGFAWGGGGGVGPTLPPVVGELNVLAIRQLKVMLTEQTLP